MMKALSLGGSLLWGRTRQGQQGVSRRRPSEAARSPQNSREHGHSVWSGGCAVATHVRVHLGEASLDVGLRAALPHGAKAEALGRVVQLQGRHAQPAAGVPTSACVCDHVQGPRAELRFSSPQIFFLGTPETPISSALTSSHPTTPQSSPGHRHQPLMVSRALGGTQLQGGTRLGGGISRTRAARSLRGKLLWK